LEDGWFYRTPRPLVGHNLIEKDHELGRGDLPAFSPQIQPDIALILDPPADTVPRACQPPAKT
jgi:hypothetical protein